MADTEDLNELIQKIVTKEINRLVDMDELDFTASKQLELYARILNTKTKKEAQSSFGSLSTEELLKIVASQPEPDPYELAKNAPLADDDDE